ncbi:MAG: hypothetical protein K2J24_01155, partial [Muribaculaceae bacterium]|nr:hypothetical protein [Muribaculaceae bacterium]
GGTPHNPGYPMPTAPTAADGLGGVSPDAQVSNPTGPVASKTDTAAPAATGTADNKAPQS